MKLLITGSTGFIGGNLIKKLQQKKYKILALSKKKNLPKSYKNVLSIKSDLKLSKNVLKKIIEFSPDILVHLAWENIPNYSKNTSHINFLKQKYFIDKIIEIDSIKKIIVTGSCSEHKSKHRLTSRFFVNAKKKLKKLIKKSGKSSVWLKLFFVFGDGQKKNSLIPYIISSINKRKNVILKKPSIINDFIHVEDVSNIIISHLQKKSENLEYDVGSGYGLRVSEIYKFLYNKKLGINCKIKKYYSCFKANTKNKKIKLKISLDKRLGSMI
tara:strand:- start:104 stop:913 length:810 start_codon:yes stop_codon:yes gene_type:complete